MLFNDMAIFPLTPSGTPPGAGTLLTLGAMHSWPSDCATFSFTLLSAFFLLSPAKSFSNKRKS